MNNSYIFIKVFKLVKLIIIIIKIRRKRKICFIFIYVVYLFLKIHEIKYKLNKP